MLLHKFNEVEKNPPRTKVQTVNTNDVADGTRVVVNDGETLTINTSNGTIEDGITGEIPEGGMTLYGKKILPPEEFKGPMGDDPFAEFKPEEKPIWQQTLRKSWDASEKKGDTGPREMPQFEALNAAMHEQEWTVAVQNALIEGKLVPENVVREMVAKGNVYLPKPIQDRYPGIDWSEVPTQPDAPPATPASSARRFCGRPPATSRAACSTSRWRWPGPNRPAKTRRLPRSSTKRLRRRCSAWGRRKTNPQGFVRNWVKWNRYASTHQPLAKNETLKGCVSWLNRNLINSLSRNR